jgi:hypothetical protein
MRLVLKVSSFSDEHSNHDYVMNEEGQMGNSEKENRRERKSQESIGQKTGEIPVFLRTDSQKA